MKRLMLPIIFALLAMVCARTQWGESIPENAQVVTIAELSRNFGNYRGQRVVLAGRMYKSLLPVHDYLNDGTGNIKVKYRGGAAEFSKEVKVVTSERALQQQEYVRVVGVVDVDRDYPLGSMIMGASPEITVTGVSLGRR